MKQLTLGELIRRLSECDPKAYLRFDFGGLVPNEVASYRGYYEQLAISYREPFSSANDVGSFLKYLFPTVGKTFSGYKGGNYTMDESTPVWVANKGNDSGTAVVGVSNYGGLVVINTEYVDS